MNPAIRYYKTPMNMAGYAGIESAQGTDKQQVDFKKISLGFEVNALFALK